MEAVEFIRTLQKLCEGKGCDDCPLHDIDICDVRYVEDPEETVRIIEEWGKEQDRQKQEKEQHKTEQERQNPENPEESRDLHAIIDELEDRIYKLADRIAALEEYHVESMNEQKRTNMDVLLAAFPNVRMNNNGIPEVCPLSLDKHYDCDKFTDCEDCRCVHWNTEVEE